MVKEREIDADRSWKGSDGLMWMEETKTFRFAFLKHDERQEQPQENNLPDKYHNNTDKGEEK